MKFLLHIKILKKYTFLSSVLGAYLYNVIVNIVVIEKRLFKNGQVIVDGKFDSFDGIKYY